MDELNRQVLINLHSSSNELSNATSLLHGEIAIKHDNVTAATIYTRTTDDKVAKFITDLAVDAKIKAKVDPVADDLSAHKTAYDLKMTALENADTANANAISAETLAREEADTGLDTRLTEVERKLGSAETESSILDRLGNVEAKAEKNAQDISTEASTRAKKDAEHDTKLENHDTRITAAKAQADKGVEDAATAQAKAEQVANDLTTTAAAIRQEFADADTQIRTDLKGSDTDEEGAETIKGALKLASTAKTKAEKGINDAATAKSAADAAQADATYAKDKIDAFQAAAEVGNAAIDTLKEIQDWIASDKSSTTEMLQSIAENKAAAAAAQKAAEGALTHSQGVSAKLTEEVDRAKAAELANTTAINNEVQARKDADAGLKGASGDAVSAETIWGAKNAAAAAQTTANQGVTDAANALTAAQNAQTAANDAKKAADGALSHSQGVANDLTTTAAAIRKEFADADAKLLGASDDAVSKETIWGAKNAAAAAQTTANTNKTNLETLSGVVVKSGEITGVGAGNTEKITGSVTGNKLTFDFSTLVIDCGTF